MDDTNIDLYISQGQLAIKQYVNCLKFIEFNGKIWYWFLWLRKNKVAYIHKLTITENDQCLIAVFALESCS